MPQRPRCVFFGVRRCSEALALRRQDVDIQESKAVVFVAKQKNDPFGHGMICHVPGIPSLQQSDPLAILRRWRDLRDSIWGPHPSQPFFCVSSSREARPVSADSFRRSLRNVFSDTSVGSHSMRKEVPSGTKPLAALTRSSFKPKGDGRPPIQCGHFTRNSPTRIVAASCWLQCRPRH